MTCSRRRPKAFYSGSSVAVNQGSITPNRTVLEANWSDKRELQERRCRCRVEVVDEQKKK